MPASEEKLELASILYYQCYSEELPLHDYKNQDIDYIIEQLNIRIIEKKDVFYSNIVH